MKCVAPLACAVSDQHALYLFEQLLDSVVNPASEATANASQSSKSLRDVAFLGLKEMLASLPANSTKSVTIAKKNIPKILTAIESQEKPAEIHIEALELLNELLSCIGPEVPKFHDQARKAIFDKLDSQNSLVRKRAVSCLGSLGPICSDQIFREIMSVTIGNLRKGGSNSNASTGIQAIWALSRTSCERLGPYLEVLAPIFFDFCNSETFEEDDSLREQCLQVLQTFCVQCRREMAPFVDDLTNIAITLSKYDPNYAYDESDDEGNSDSVEMTDAEGADDEDDFLDFDDDGDDSDDGDHSWKVRRGAIRCIHAIISGQLLASDVLYAKFGLFLVSRFKEREENVKLDVFDAFMALLRIRTATAAVAPPTASQSLDTFSAQIVMDMDIGNSSDLAPLHDRALVIVRSLRKELGGRSEDTRVKVMSVLLELVKAAPRSLAPYFGKLVDEVERGLSDESANLKTETLLFLKGVAAAGAPPMKDYIAKLVEKILQTAEDRYFKITAESLRLCEVLVSTFGAAPNDCRSAMSPLTPKIYDAAEKRITAADHDSEVKEAALVCIGSTVSFFGDSLGEERLAKVGTILCGRLKNEVTRLASVRAMLKIAKSNKGNVFLPVAAIVTSTVVAFLRKNAPTLRAASLELLSAIPALAPESDATLLANVSELITDGDLKMSHLALCVLSSLIRARGASIYQQIAADGGAYEKALKLAVSPVLQGRAVDALLDALNALAKVNGAPLTVERMVRDLQGLVKGIDTVGTAAIKSPLFSIAKCVAVVCAGAAAAFRSSIVAGLISSTKSNDPKTGVFSLACLGEFGKRSLLTNANEQAQVQQVILEVLDSPITEVKAAAAVSLGGLASANGETGLSALLHLINERPAIRYLLLLALKDAITFSAPADVLKTMPLMLPLLWNSVPTSSLDKKATPAVSDDESRRVVISECLGLLAQAAPKDVVPTLRDAVTSERPEIRGVVLSCLRFAFSASTAGASAAQALSAELEPILMEFVCHIDDADVTVSQNALQAVNAIARTRPAILAPNIGRILPHVYQRTHKNPDMVETINLGPFQHEVDYGLDLRKMAFGLMRTLITGPLARLVPISTFLENVVIGLGDQADVRAMAQLILGAVTMSPYALHIVEMLTPVVKALTVTLNEKLKDNAVRQEAERHADSIRGALRATRMLEKVPEIAEATTFKNFMDGVIKRRFADKYGKIVAETDLMNTAPGAGVSPRGGGDVMRD